MTYFLESQKRNYRQFWKSLNFILHIIFWSYLNHFGTFPNHDHWNFGQLYKSLHVTEWYLNRLKAILEVALFQMRFVIFTLRKSWLAIFSRNLHDCILPHCNLDIFPTGKRVSHRGKYEIEIPANFNFYGPKKAIKLAQK